MYEFIFEQCILRYLNYTWIFIWTVHFKMLEFYMKKNFLMILRSISTIRVYFVFSIPCQKYIFDNLDHVQASFNELETYLIGVLI
jgi:hypothetical protein